MLCCLSEMMRASWLKSRNQRTDASEIVRKLLIQMCTASHRCEEFRRKPLLTFVTPHAAVEQLWVGLRRFEILLPLLERHARLRGKGDHHHCDGAEREERTFEHWPVKASAVAVLGFTHPESDLWSVHRWSPSSRNLPIVSRSATAMTPRIVSPPRNDHRVEPPESNHAFELVS